MKSERRGVSASVSAWAKLDEAKVPQDRTNTSATNRALSGLFEAVMDFFQLGLEIGDGAHVLERNLKEMLCREKENAKINRGREDLKRRQQKGAQNILTVGLD